MAIPCATLQFQDVNRDGQTRENGATDADAAHNAQLDEMQARIDYCNDEKADLLISLHFDGSRTEPVRVFDLVCRRTGG